jgi:hypothetical protein
LAHILGRARKQVNETSDTDSGVSRNDIFRVDDEELTNPVVTRAAEN